MKKGADRRLVKNDSAQLRYEEGGGKHRRGVKTGRAHKSCDKGTAYTLHEGEARTRSTYM